MTVIDLTDRRVRPDVPTAGGDDGALPPAGPVGELARVIDRLQQTFDGPSVGADGERLLALRRQLDRAESVWLSAVAGFDRSGLAAAAGARSTASWLRHHARLAPGQAAQTVNLARAVGGQLADTGAALADGNISVRHAAVVLGAADAVAQAAGPEPVAETERILLAATAQMDPQLLGRLGRQIRYQIDPPGAEADAQAEHERRWLNLSPTFGGVVHIDGLLDAESGAIVLAALQPLARPAAVSRTRRCAGNAGSRSRSGRIPRPGRTSRR